jgi:beta-1,4-N-acetylglucosaminyltransferase
MKLCLVCSQGGHMSEMLRLQSAFDEHDYFFVTFKSDALNDLKNTYFIQFTKNKRFARIMMFRTFLEAAKIMHKERPDLIVSTGSGIIAIPFCYVGKLLGIRIVYIETLARVTSPSLCGKFIYPIADLFLVQWESLLSAYGRKAKYWGRVI